MADLAPTVAILTYGVHPALAYGTLLVFKTLRTGFPTARIEVYDNGSHPEVRDQVMKACADVDATFVGMAPIHWAEHFRWLIHRRPHDGGPLVLLDPDVVFWRNVEGWDFGDSLMAGRLMRKVEGPGFVSHARLHPSLLWIDDVSRARAALGADGIAPRVTVIDGRVNLWDTFALSYRKNEASCARFSAEHLDCFDHQFFGTHLPIIDAQVGASFDVIRAGHAAAAAGDLGAIRGAWRAQDDYFHGAAAAQAMRDRSKTVAERQLACAMRLQEAQGMAYDDDALRAAVGTLKQRVSGAIDEREKGPARAGPEGRT